MAKYEFQNYTCGEWGRSGYASNANFIRQNAYLFAEAVLE